MKISGIGKKLYQYIADHPVPATICFWGFRLYKRIRWKECRPAVGRPVPVWAGTKRPSPKDLKQLKVAMICDEMTWENWKRECDVVALTPHNWKKVLCRERPDVLFCESAWIGLQEHRGCWHGLIYRNHRILFDNRKELFCILDFCRKYGIPTVFWNKEDPAFFDSVRYDFKDTALKFDWIFTTAAECVPLYRKMGHKQTDVMMFGFSPYLFSPLNSLPKERRVVFAGSWLAEDQNRCRDMVQLFDLMQEHQIPLTIYDRQTHNTKEGRKFPEKYRTCVRDCVPFTELGQKIKHAKYALNINTVTDSDTMFARRVFELAASNVMPVSNASKGMQRIFPGTIRYLHEPFTEEYVEKDARRNLDEAYASHTNRIRFTEMFNRMGLLPKPDKVRIGVLDPKNLLHGQTVRGRWFEAKPILKGKEAGKEPFAYGIHLSGARLKTMDAVLSHFCYLPEKCGIRITGEPLYEILKDAGHEDVVYTWDLFMQVQKNPDQITAKYILGAYEE